MGRYDANFGNVLSINKEKEAKVASLGKLKIKGQVRRIEPIQIGGKTSFILAKNDDYLQVIRLIE